MPAPPCTLVAHATTDSEVVRRRVETATHGTSFAVVSTGLSSKAHVQVTLASATGISRDLVIGSTPPRDAGEEPDAASSQRDRARGSFDTDLACASP